MFDCPPYPPVTYEGTCVRLLVGNLACGLGRGAVAPPLTCGYVVSPPFSGRFGRRHRTVTNNLETTPDLQRCTVGARCVGVLHTYRPLPVDRR